MEIIDISRTLSNALAPWPGDTPFHFELKWKMTDGAPVNVGAVQMGLHNGTHADAAFHFEANGKTSESLPLDVFIGPALVVDLTKDFSSDAAKITVADLAPFANEIANAPRVLLKTGGWPDSEVFPKKIPVVARDVPQWLGLKGVRLLGVDLPSVDPIESKDLANHHALRAADIAIVESLDLSRVTMGVYQFSGLPLKIAGGDAAPVRAILWR
jgi:arylformamidase